MEHSARRKPRPRVNLVPRLRALDRTGMAISRDGTIVHAFELASPSASLTGRDDHRELAHGLRRLAVELPLGAGLQLYVRCSGREDGAAPLTSHVLVAASDAVGRFESTRVRARFRRTPALAALLQAEQVRSLLRAAGIRARRLDGSAFAALIARRITDLRDGGATPAPAIEIVGHLDRRREQAEARSAAAALARNLAAIEAAPSGSAHVKVGHVYEQVLYLASAPKDAGFGWVAGCAQRFGDCVASTHIRRPVERDGELMVSVYVALREDGDAAGLAGRVDGASQLLAHDAKAVVHRGEFAQDKLWPSTLPLADDVARLGHPVDPGQAAHALAPLSPGAGSPAGCPVGYAVPDGRLELVDPWDPVHRMAGLLVVGDGSDAVARALASRIAGARRLAVTELDTSDAAPLPLEALERATAEPPRETLFMLGDLSVLLAQGDCAVRLQRAARATRRAGSALLATLDRLPSAATSAARAAMRAFPIVFLLPPVVHQQAAIGELFHVPEPELGGLTGAGTIAPAALWVNGDRGPGLITLFDSA